MVAFGTVANKTDPFAQIWRRRRRVGEKRRVRGAQLAVIASCNPIREEEIS